MIYSIAVETRSNCVHLDVAGVGDREGLQQLDRELRAVLERMGRTSGAGRPSLLIDGSSHGVQSQAFITEVSATVAGWRELTLRIAVVSASTLHKFQSDRVGADESHRAFLSRQDALNWLSQA